MEKKGARSQRSAESVERILQATLELAIELGYEGTTISKVSKRSGFPSGSIYWHFGDKDKLFSALLDRYVNEWFGRYDWTIHEGERPVDRLTEIMINRAKEARDPSSAWGIGLLMALERRLEGSEARQKFLDIRRDRLEFIAKFWQENLPDNVLAAAPDLSIKLSQFAIAFSDGWVISASANEDWDLEGLAEVMVTSLDQMIGAAERKALLSNGRNAAESNVWGQSLSADDPEAWGP
ncbi:TetR/AcrR family transcriptional regulator [Corynebacterium sp. A21]|uniref:TetR/AcrR family transcriptional regulator n=1 Tax=Corynebacterium sp. A21 TaxID=3457318 RepID=UPI003FD1E92F